MDPEFTARVQWQEELAHLAETLGLAKDSCFSNILVKLNQLIGAAHPSRTKRYDLFAEACHLVSVKQSKYALIGLVNWLLVRAEGEDADGFWRKQVEAAKKIGYLEGKRDAAAEIARDLLNKP